MEFRKKLIKFLFLFILLFISCENNDYIFNYPPTQSTRLNGIWEQKKFTQGGKDTTLTFYHFTLTNEFEYGRSQFRYGKYQDTLIQGGSYTIPAPYLLMLSYEYSKRSENITPLVKFDTLVYGSESMINLIICELGRSFTQVSGKTGELLNSTFYDREKYGERLMHTKYFFKKDTVYFYSLFNDYFKEPDDWPGPIKYTYNISGPFIHFYMADGRIVTRGLAQYQSKLIMTYTQKIYKYKIR